MKQFFKDEPRLLAHRGMPLEYPENTLLSFEKAVEFGVDVIETDTHYTKDKRFVILHDDELSRVSNGTGNVSDYTLAKLKELDAAYNFTPDGGETYPYRDQGITFVSVDEVLKKFPDQKFNIDLKDNNPDQVKDWSELIEKYDAQDRVLTASQYKGNLKQVRQSFPEMATCFSAGEIFSFYIRNKIGGYKWLQKKTYKGDAIQIPVKMGPLRLVSDKTIKNAHKIGFRIHVWTINDAKTMRSLFEKGVDAIFTDNPRVLKKVVGEIF
ncbi:MAG: glycerophosphodiester phosphodiesterase [Promethearchaeia archaeon]